ncbi:MAG: 23S rRNA (guanosine(2251)-2'-O)-methyltransferase RlmB [Coriobacteriia bacterium]|nr:23S rRNA (guanosine(2251)-2'-O)-methyltransferase RlmB [Coriobacteriia bacterium]
MSDFIEGRRAALEALKTKVPVKAVLVQKQQKGQKPDKKLDDIVKQFKDEHIAVRYVDKSKLDHISSHGAHQGIALEVGGYPYVSLPEILEAASSKNELILVLDHITDEGNLGAIIRSAEVVGAAGVILPANRSAQVGVGVYKTSAGAAMHIKIARVANLSQALQTMKEAGFWVVGASEHATQTLWQAPLEGKICLVAGSEGKGISPLVQKNCDFLVKLPQRGQLESLNVAQATTAICYEWLRRFFDEEA